MIRHKIAFLFVLALLPGCQQWDGTTAALQRQETMRSTAPEDLYANGMAMLRARRYQPALDNFEAIEREHPQSTWATNARLMSAYTDYQRNRYTEALGALDRFIQLHPAHRDIAYAYYLRALCQYEQINDAQRDQRQTEVAMQALQDVINRFPETPYARDARLKMDLARDHLAGREMVIGRYYQRQRLYAAGIGRYRRVIDEFQTTNHVPEAMMRLVESYTALGLPDEARRVAAVLGYNYPGSIWYRDAFRLVGDTSELPPDERPSWWARTFGSARR